ncbi:MAG: ribbon-helix-helix protein, CopG family [Hahellaceae bacterium]|nr:ribbon-helix-helix protein, CopG family [Hahellaceae bacterium]
MLIRLSDELRENLKVLAENDGRSTTNLIERILEQYVQEQKERLQAK